MRAPEENYAVIELKMKTIVFGCERFDTYIVGNPNVTIFTDHKALENFFKKPLVEVPKRLQSLLLGLQRYRLIVKYREGKKQVLAVAWSRAPEENHKSCNQG